MKKMIDSLYSVQENLSSFEEEHEDVKGYNTLNYPVYILDDLTYVRSWMNTSTGARLERVSLDVIQRHVKMSDVEIISVQWTKVKQLKKEYFSFLPLYERPWIDELENKNLYFVVPRLDMQKINAWIDKHGLYEYADLVWWLIGIVQDQALYDMQYGEDSWVGLSDDDIKILNKTEKKDISTVKKFLASYFRVVNGGHRLTDRVTETDIRFTIYDDGAELKPTHSEAIQSRMLQDIIVSGFKSVLVPFKRPSDVTLEDLHHSLSRLMPFNTPFERSRNFFHELAIGTCNLLVEKGFAALSPDGRRIKHPHKSGGKYTPNVLVAELLSLAQARYQNSLGSGQIGKWYERFHS